MVRATTEYRGTVLDAPDADVLVWSDLHLGHANIIDYQGRSFFDADDMSAELWRAFERVLRPESVLVLVHAATWITVLRSGGDAMRNKVAAEQISARKALAWLRDQTRERSNRVLFRGQRHAWPTIKPSITRECEATKRRIWAIVRWFCSHKARHVTGYSIENVHDRLAILQHYFGRSPVVDLTATPEVALYFALKNAEDGDNCVVYSVDRESAGAPSVVFSDHDFLALPLGDGGSTHRWLRQDGYSVGPKDWWDPQEVENFDVLGLSGVGCMHFSKRDSDDALVADLGDLESIADDPLAYQVRGSVQTFARTFDLLTPDVIAILDRSATVDPDAEISSRIDNLMVMAKEVDAPPEVFSVLYSLKAAREQNQWDTSFDAGLRSVEQKLGLLPDS